MSDLQYNSRRSAVVCCNGCVASSQPLASQVGTDILKAGGNAADAAVAMAAVLNVTEPCSTGIGGDAFCLFYDAKSKQVKAVNGSGRAPAALTLDLLHKQGFSSSSPFPVQHGHAVTVPGAAAAWVDTVDRFGSGKLSLTQILQPAVDLAENGYPVQQITALLWNKGAESLLTPKNDHGRDLLVNGRAPTYGEVIRLPYLAQTFRELGTHGKKGFYEGRIAKAIVAAVEKFGGVMTADDLQNHVTTFEDPISTDYRGYRLWEIPPNGHGMAALIALNVLETYDLKQLGANSAEYLHLVIEALKLGFSDTTWYCADPTKVDVPLSTLLSKEYATKRRQLVTNNRAMKNVQKGDLNIGPDTVYFTTADSEGNACSFINSNFMGFGSAIVPEGCGFTLQNRGSGFSLDTVHPNVIAPGKRPYHTIIPAMVTDSNTGDLVMSYGVMGGYMQPQGHVQVLLNMLEFGMNPQQALDQPRICIGGGYGYDESYVSVEDGIPTEAVEGLVDKGHSVRGPLVAADRTLFGKGQAIAVGNFWDQSDNSAQRKAECIYWCGSDPRADGLAIGF
ncbi:glutathione hydrolase-like YwrD proenzyme [Ylistrum balloti]|uniref:glutathione hydrolase-like YwrD proenzyme n=1 Tax=Ylistrum balloti TaxID=509963 RepID=UPI002905C3D2|nr:glutathione hydrolase-like YwrD proenzyme [Ylistrum balloti]